MKSTDKQYIYIDYAEEDGKSAERIYNALEQRGFNPWTTNKNLRSTQTSMFNIQNAIENSVVFLTLISNYALTRYGTLYRELRSTLGIAREKPEGEILILLVSLDGREPEEEDITDLYMIDISESYEAGISQILRTIERKLPELRESKVDYYRPSARTFKKRVSRGKSFKKQVKKIPGRLLRRIAHFLASLSDMGNISFRHKLIHNAFLNDPLRYKLFYDGPTSLFCSELVQFLHEYGTLEDGRNPIVSVLESAKSYIGWANRRDFEQLFKELKTYVDITKHERFRSLEEERTLKKRENYYVSDLKKKHRHLMDRLWDIYTSVQKGDILGASILLKNIDFSEDTALIKELYKSNIVTPMNALRDMKELYFLQKAYELKKDKPVEEAISHLRMYEEFTSQVVFPVDTRWVYELEEESILETFLKRYNGTSSLPYFNVEEKRISSSVGWLHLSDLYIGMDKHDTRGIVYKESFFEDLKWLHEKCGPWDIVFLTGDITFVGDKENFQPANKFMQELWNRFDEIGSNPRLCAVPGNHDLYRPHVGGSLLKLYRNYVKFTTCTHAFREKKDEFVRYYRELLSQPFNNYMNWWEHQKYKPSNVTSGILPGDFSATIEVNGVKVGILGLNTAFLHLSDIVERILLLDTEQFHAACGGDGRAWAKKHHVYFLLTHHPPASLHKEALEQYNNEINVPGRFALHLCGHMHHMPYRDIYKGGTEARPLWQGRPLFNRGYFIDKGYSSVKGYSAGRVEIKGNKGYLTIWPRAISGSRSRIFYEPDYSLALTEDLNTKPVEFKPHMSFKEKTRVKLPPLNRDDPKLKEFMTEYVIPELIIDKFKFSSHFVKDDKNREKLVDIFYKFYSAYADSDS